MNMQNTGMQSISRLVVVSKDFSTYYIPGKTMIIDKLVYQICEIGNDYQMLDIDGRILSTVSKLAPCVVDYSDVYEADMLDPELEANLVNFGNFLLDEYGVMAMNTKGEEAYQRQVTHADICNWMEKINNPTPSDMQEVADFPVIPKINEEKEFTS